MTLDLPLPAYLADAARMGGCTEQVIADAWAWLCEELHDQLVEGARFEAEWRRAWRRQRGFAKSDAAKQERREQAAEARRKAARDRAADDGYTGSPVSRVRSTGPTEPVAGKDVVSAALASMMAATRRKEVGT